jgi:hypothetical protein
MSKVITNEPITVTLTYDVEDGATLSPPRRVELAITPDLAAAFARAAVVNRSDATPLSFTSLLTAMVTGSDAVSMWLKDELATYGVTASRIAGRRSRNYSELSSLPNDVVSTPGELATSVSARQAIEEGQAIASAVGAGAALDIRHLAAAYPILPKWHENDFNELGIDRLAWCRAFGAYLAKMFPEEKWYWRRYANRASPVPLTLFSSDVYTETDLIGIDRTVDALALLVASTRTGTPLSIGIFGEWGSGKSFFMRHLRKRIWTLAEREQSRVAAWIDDKRQNGTATDDDAPLYYGRVAQVEFNAWHYNEGNLVASLVDHLFRNLRVLPAAKDNDLEEQRAAVLIQISGVQVGLTEASTAIQQTRDQLNDARTKVAQATEEAEAARKDVDALL